MAHNPECGLDCVSAGAVRGQPADANQQTGRQHRSGDQSAEQAKHTPGPWSPRDGFVPFIYAAGGEIVADTIVRNNDVANAKANARLIAAAPEMYEALVAMLRTCPAPRTEGSAYWHACKAATQAANKAEGRDR